MVSNHFRKRTSGPILSRPEADRQGRISTLAFVTLGSSDAIAFLNGWHDVLGGRPLDLAIKSEEGFLVVEQALATAASGG